MIDLSTSIADALSDLINRVKRSLVILHNGHHGVGAGIIWSCNGLILTNYHVVAQDRRVSATVGETGKLPARLIAKDPEIDLALLCIEAEELPAAIFADSRNLRVGQLVLAVGNPWGQRGVVTASLISSLSQAQTRGPRGSIDIIRSDVHLAPGNSGGPLVNATGAVVGINTMIVGGDQGIAVPSHVASAFADQVIGRPAEVLDESHKWITQGKWGQVA